MRNVLNISLLVIVSFSVVYGAAYESDRMNPGSPSLSDRELAGKQVVNTEGEYLGKISDVVVDPKTQKVTIMMISSDVLNIGDKLIPVPVNAVTVSGDKIIIRMTKIQLAQAPSYDRDDLPAISDRTTYERTYRFFGISPQWQPEETNMKDGTTGK